VDDRAVPIGAGLLARVAFEALTEHTA